MTLELIQTPTASITTVLAALARHARANPSDDVIMINRSVTAEQWPKSGGPLAGHLSWHGVEAEHDVHAEFLRVQGWTSFEKDDAQWWAVRSDMPRWVTVDYLLPRCMECATKNWIECRCGDLTDAGKKRRHEYCYVLELQADNHFYVGRTIHPEKRMEEHLEGRGAPWTSLHKPVSIRAMQRVFRDTAQQIEDQTTRLGRSVGHLVETVQRIETAGAGFRSLTEGIDTTTTTGRLLLHLFASLAQFERDLIKDRINAGVKAAKARGRSGGRPRVMDDIKAAKAERMIAAGQLTLPEVARRLGVGESTLRTWRRANRQEAAAKTPKASATGDPL